MGVDTDISRNSSFSQHAKGNKIHTQTIDFVVDTSSTLTVFEKMLRQNIDFDAIKDDPEQLQTKCKDFVGKYRCTHYVRAIHLGAVEYEVMSSETYSRVYSTRGELGVAGLHHASASAKAGVQRKKGKKTYDRKYTKIGKWNDEFEIVEEKVIEIEITPIQMLIKTPQLQIALANAVKEYRKERLQERPVGPFLMKCGPHAKPYYLMGSEDGRVIVTEDKANATMFSLILENIKHPTEFAIQKFSDGGATVCLASEVTIDGKSPPHMPPVLTDNYTDVNIRMSLKDRMKRKHTQIDPNEWLEGVDWLFIRCACRKGVIPGKGKLCILKRSRSAGFELSVVPSTTAHNNCNVFMRFCLEKVELKSFEYHHKRKTLSNF